MAPPCRRGPKLLGAPPYRFILIYQTRSQFDPGAAPGISLERGREIAQAISRRGAGANGEKNVRGTIALPFATIVSGPNAMISGKARGRAASATRRAPCRRRAPPPGQGLGDESRVRSWLSSANRRRRGNWSPNYRNLCGWRLSRRSTAMGREQGPENWTHGPARPPPPSPGRPHSPIAEPTERRGKRNEDEANA
jgi:hypothetical protein